MQDTTEEKMWKRWGWGMAVEALVSTPLVVAEDSNSISPLKAVFLVADSAEASLGDLNSIFDQARL